MQERGGEVLDLEVNREVTGLGNRDEDERGDCRRDRGCSKECVHLRRISHGLKDEGEIDVLGSVRVCGLKGQGGSVGWAAHLDSER